MFSKNNTDIFYCILRFAGNCIVTSPSQIAVVSGPSQSRMIIGQCTFRMWFIGKYVGA